MVFYSQFMTLVIFFGATKLVEFFLQISASRTWGNIWRNLNKLDINDNVTYSTRSKINMKKGEGTQIIKLPQLYPITSKKPNNIENLELQLSVTSVSNILVARSASHYLCT